MTVIRSGGYLHSRPEPPSSDVAHLETEGYLVLRGALTTAEIDELRQDIDRVFAEFPPDVRRPTEVPDYWDEFRYEVLNRSATAQRVVGHQAILDVVEPLLGEDCHVIANTAWRNPPGVDITHGGGRWHIDGGPHVPLPEGIDWDPRIPHPVFAIATHILLQDMPIESGPTGVIPRSHLSGQRPPADRSDDLSLTWQGTAVLPLVAEAGDVVLFVSDTWHRRLPTRSGDPGRDFLQIHYGRRDIAQRLRPTTEINQLSDEAVQRASSDRQRTVVGLHRPFFYDG